MVSIRCHVSHERHALSRSFCIGGQSVVPKETHVVQLSFPVTFKREIIGRKYIISSLSYWSSFKTPRAEHTALPAPSVHHDCLQFTCVSQPCILQHVVNISHCLPSSVCMSIRWLPQDFIIVSDTMPSEPHSSLLYCGGYWR